MKTITTFIQTLIAISLLTSTAQLHAHALKENNARIILRDGQVEVRIMVDTHRWQLKLKDQQAWLMGDTEQVMKKDLPYPQKKQFLQKLLTTHTQLKLNGQEVKLKLTSFPKNLSQPHGGFVELALSGHHKQVHAKKIDLSFPKSLGAIHASFVQPEYKLIAAGKSAAVSFDSGKQLVEHNHSTAKIIHSTHH